MGTVNWQANLDTRFKPRSTAFTAKKELIIDIKVFKSILFLPIYSKKKTPLLTAKQFCVAQHIESMNFRIKNQFIMNL